ncbi:cation:proton antiporter [Azohydromonas sediminis]|uniref:cation:proton antiporter domain-containing protein n=1 Tax=Azohydromonas sediminis TaxID=2259674 RepID=UPI000E647433|nr:cation:proton antiporter [Azohydromonas sediminis]
MDLASPFVQTLLLLGCAVAVVLAFQRLRIPSSLGYLLVGVLLGPHTAGPVVDTLPLQALAEFGIVFLLFTIGLNFSLPQIHALRHLVLGLGTAQVALTTAAVGALAWAAGLAPAAAFVVGAVFAQSSTTIIGRQLAEQGEDQSRHARLGLGMSVFQDVTAAPFVVVIPVLAAASAATLGGTLAWALAKAALAFALVFVVGRWLLRPLFHRVAAHRSAELFTLTVLFVSLAAGATTHALGLSMAFGAFLAGMVLGETEFRHQVEATIRPFRDVLLGLFFVGIGMLFDPAALARVWHWGLLGAFVLVTVKAALVAGLVRAAGIDATTAWRTGILLAVGGEFGFALLAIGLQAGVVDEALGQAVLASVLFSMLAGPWLIRHHHALARRLVRAPAVAPGADAPDAAAPPQPPAGAQVLLAGYGRVGQSLGHFLESEGIAYAALDMDAERVRKARRAGEPVHYGDSSQLDVLLALGLDAARLVVVTHDDTAAALRTVQQVRQHRPQVPVLVRTRGPETADALRAAGASEVVPETLEATLALASQALRQLGVPAPRVARRVMAERAGHYRQLRGTFGGDPSHADDDAERLHALQIAADAPPVGEPLSALPLDGVIVSALVRQGRRRLQPAPETRVEAGDTLVLFGHPQALARAEDALLRGRLRPPSASPS